MKKTILMALMLSVILFSCSKDEEQATLSFTLSVTGEAPNAKVTIVNNTVGATEYKWTFSEGADVTGSTKETPEVITVDKVGEFSVDLEVINGTATTGLTKTIKINGENGIATYSDVEFSQKIDDSTMGRFFSVADGKIYKYSQIGSSNSSLIDLAFRGDNSTFIFFESPDDLMDDENVISGANKTKIKNYNSGFEVSDFDSMTSEILLKDLTVEHDDEVIGSLDFPLIVLFETSKGKKGAIKLKEINTNRLKVDIKVQKY